MYVHNNQALSFFICSLCYAKPVVASTHFKSNNVKSNKTKAKPLAIQPLSKRLKTIKFPTQSYIFFGFVLQIGMQSSLSFNIAMKHFYDPPFMMTQRQRV